MVMMTMIPNVKKRDLKILIVEKTGGKQHKPCGEKTGGQNSTNPLWGETVYGDDDGDDDDDP
jgi:hypothetical protein